MAFTTIVNAKPLPDPDHPVVVGDRCLGGPLPEPGVSAGLRRDAPLPLPGAVRARVDGPLQVRAAVAVRDPGQRRGRGAERAVVRGV